MDERITYISNTPILINTTNNDAMNKIINWIELLQNMDSLFLLPLTYEDVDLTDFETNKLYEKSKFEHKHRLASLGIDYPKWSELSIKIHSEGETWNFERLKTASNTGLTEWYVRTIFEEMEIENDTIYDKEFINIVYEIACNDDDVKIFGTAFHRMKIMNENFLKIIDFLDDKAMYENLTIKGVERLYTSKVLIDKCKIILDHHKKTFEIVTNFYSVEKITDNIQMLLFYRIKNIINASLIL